MAIRPATTRASCSRSRSRERCAGCPGVGKVVWGFVSLAVTARRAVNVEDDGTPQGAQWVSGDAGVSAPHHSRDSRSVGRTFLLEYGLLAASKHLVADEQGSGTVFSSQSCGGQGHYWPRRDIQ
jgi:hypothetical protein